MRSILIIVAVALASCQSVNGFTATCIGAETAHAAFHEWTKTHSVTRVVLESEPIAYQSAHRICADPANANKANLTAELASAALQISFALATAQKEP